MAANRKVMASFGAVEVLMGLIEGGKSLKVKLEAWEAILQLLQSSDACQRFLDRRGLPMVLGFARDRDARVRHKAAQVLGRCLAKDLIRVADRVAPVYVDGLCRFLLDSHAPTSEAAGATLLALARASIAEGLVWDPALVARVAQTLASVRAVLDSQPYVVRNKGHAHALVPAPPRGVSLPRRHRVSRRAGVKQGLGLGMGLRG